MKSVQKLSFWSAKSLNDIFKGDGPLLESDESEGGGEAGGAGRDDNDGGDQPGWEGAGGEQEEEEDRGEKEKGKEKVEDLRLPGLGKSSCHKFLQSISILLAQLVHLLTLLLIVNLPLFLVLHLCLHSLATFISPRCSSKLYRN